MGVVQNKNGDKNDSPGQSWLLWGLEEMEAQPQQWWGLRPLSGASALADMSLLFIHHILTAL